MTNELAIFSNGLAFFRRHFTLSEKEQTLSIPFRKSHMGDALATLELFGNVNLVRPPSFRMIDNEVNLHLNTANVLLDICQKFTGSEIKIHRKTAEEITGKLLGTHEYQEQNGPTIAKKYEVGVIHNGRVLFTALNEIKSIEFADTKVKSEIARALDVNYQKITPESTFLDICVSGKEKTPFTIEYAFPTSAFKQRYQLRHDKGKYKLSCAAVVSNPTDEDWNDFLISVVVGDPITFDTDLAEKQLPIREKVKLAATKALGPISAEHLPAAAPTRSYAFSAACARETLDNECIVLADSPNVESFDLDDCAIFQSKSPTSIEAKRSSLIPLFTSEIEASPVLVYRESANATRPWLGLRIKNIDNFSWGKGVCNIVNNGTYMGMGLIECTKPQESQLVIHSKENRVQIRKKKGNVITSTISTEINKGICQYFVCREQTSIITVQNNVAEKFDLEIEHERSLNSNSTIIVKGVEGDLPEIKNGVRISQKLQAKETLHLEIREKYLEKQRISLTQEPGVEWLINSFLVMDKEKANRTELKEIQSAYKKWTAAKLALAEAEKHYRSLEKTHKRKISMVKIGDTGAISDRWKNELDAVDKEMDQLAAAKLPILEVAIKKAWESLNVALEQLSIKFADE
jgi:hypothetical protein